MGGEGEGGVMWWPSTGEGRHMGFAKTYTDSIEDTLRHWPILARDGLSACFHTCGSAQASDLDAIFDRQWQAVHWAEGISTGSCIIGSGCLLPGLLFVGDDDRIELRVVEGDAVEVQFPKFRCGYLSCLQRCEHGSC